MPESNFLKPINIFNHLNILRARFFFKILQTIHKLIFYCFVLTEELYEFPGLSVASGPMFFKYFNNTYFYLSNVHFIFKYMFMSMTVYMYPQIWVPVEARRGHQIPY